MKEKFDPTTKVGSNMVGIVGGSRERVPAAWNPTDLFLVSLPERDELSLFLVPAGCLSFGLSLALPFCLPCVGFDHRFFYWIFIYLFCPEVPAYFCQENPNKPGLCWLCSRKGAE